MAPSSRPSDAKFDAVRKDIVAILKNKDYDDGSIGPVLVRLAWHASGTYCKDTKTGGSNGAGMRYEKEGGDPANAGLQHARVFLEPIKEKYEGITYADLWTLAGVVAIKAMGGPDIKWVPGRTDFGDDSALPPRGRLPDAGQAAQHLRNIFYRMGFNDQEIVALSGAHALGRCHTDRSGFDGPWTFSPTTFSNEYYKLLLDEKWNLRKWEGPIQYQDKSTKSLMMLTTDMALVQDKAFSQYTKKYAKSEEAFFKDFSAAFSKLLELGVPEVRWAEGAKITDGKHLELKPTSDQ